MKFSLYLFLSVFAFTSFNVNFIIDYNYFVEMLFWKSGTDVGQYKQVIEISLLTLGEYI